MFENDLILIVGAGDLATGVALRLWRAGFKFVMTELQVPTAIRLSVAFASAVFNGKVTVEEATATLVKTADEISTAWIKNEIPVIVDPELELLTWFTPRILIDARIAKRNLGTHIDQAPFVIGLGPGFTAGEDVDAVIETNRGHYLGRVILNGSAEPNTDTPGDVMGLRRERVLYSPADGAFRSAKSIGALVKSGELLGHVNGEPLISGIDGVLRGLIHDGVQVRKGLKIGDVDPRASIDHCFTVSDKALSIGGGVLEAILSWMGSERYKEISGS